MRTDKINGFSIGWNAYFIDTSISFCFMDDVGCLVQPFFFHDPSMSSISQTSCAWKISDSPIVDSLLY